MHKDRMRLLARAVWYECSLNKSYVQIALLLWRAVALTHPNVITERRVKEVKTATTQGERDKIICTWLKGIVDNVLIQVYKLGLTEAFLAEPEKFTQAYVWELRKAQQETR